MGDIVILSQDKNFEKRDSQAWLLTWVLICVLSGIFRPSSVPSPVYGVMVLGSVVHLTVISWLVLCLLLVFLVDFLEQQWSLSPVHWRV